MSDIKTLSIDIETYSGYDLSKCGVYKYVEHPDFDILLFGYAVNGGEVNVVDLACGEEIPEEVLSALSDESVTKWAFNASFERVCLSMWLRRSHPEYFHSYSIEEDSVGNYLDPEAWRCSMVWSAYMGLKFNVDGLLRGDYQSQMNGYATAKQNGWMSANDIRELENLDRVPAEEGGDLYLINGNMTKLQDAGLFAAGYDSEKEGKLNEEALELEKQEDQRPGFRRRSD